MVPGNRVWTASVLAYEIFFSCISFKVRKPVYKDEKKENLISLHRFACPLVHTAWLCPLSGSSLPNGRTRKGNARGEARGKMLAKVWKEPDGSAHWPAVAERRTSSESREESIAYRFHRDPKVTESFRDYLNGRIDRSILWSSRKGYCSGLSTRSPPACKHFLYVHIR